ncbi:MAG: DUF2752 domain-containing protein [Bacteroidales bacterium]
MANRLKHITKWLYQNLELIFWISAILALFMIRPGESHFSLCPLQNLGIDHCPGCGLGRSCSLALHGNILESLSMHPFGIFALIVILHRIFILITNSIKFSHPKTHQL